MQHFGCPFLLAMTVGWSCDAVLGGDAEREIKWGEGVAAAVMREKVKGGVRDHTK